MVDLGRSDDPRVQAQLDRLSTLSVPQGRFDLDAISALMGRLGNPHRKLPPVFHVAGTNGKGSVCAFLRAILEADGKRVHVTTSPHLVRYNERFRIAGDLISDEALAALLEEVLDASENIGPSLFEATIAAAFLAFSREPADACIVEVGLGGRLDATNVLEAEAVAACGIAALGLDHEKFLLAPEVGVPTEPMARIAFEKAGIAKKGVPLVTFGVDAYPDEAREVMAEIAKRAGALLHSGFSNFRIDGSHAYLSDDAGRESLLEPSLAGQHQLANAGLAITMLMQQQRVPVSAESIVAGIRTAQWPARLQLLSEGPLTSLVPDHAVWVDGGHNTSAGRQIAGFFDGPVHLILGMLSNKNPRALLDPLGDKVRRPTIVPVPGYKCHPVGMFGPEATAASNLRDALLQIPRDDHPILIAGSLHLAGEALRLNHETPD